MSVVEPETRSDLSRPATGRWSLGLGLLGAPIAWAIHLLLCWVIAEWSGLTGSLESAFLGLAVRDWLLIGVSLATLGAAVAATLLARGCVSRLRDVQSRDRSQAWFVARAGVMTGYVFTFVIAVETLPIFFHLRGA